jgi:hypothetical protein
LPIRFLTVNTACWKTLRTPHSTSTAQTQWCKRFATCSTFERAAKKVTPWPDLPRAVCLSAATVSWSKADPKLRAWVEENRQALELLQRGAEKAEATEYLAGDPLTFGPMMSPGDLTSLALLEGSKRQESGDAAGAWDCYRAVLRMTAHISRRGSLEPRWRVNAIVLARGWLRKRLATWAADPGTTIAQLHGALDEVLRAEPRPEWDSYAMKIGYIEVTRWLERPMNRDYRELVEGEQIYRLGDLQVPVDVMEWGEAARRFLLREPERSRRVLRLLCADWLAHVETPGQRTRPPAVLVLLRGTKPVRVPLYPVSPDVPAGARALTPREVASWLLTTRDAKLLLLLFNSRGEIWRPIRVPGRREHRKVVILLATEIYRRERGALPPSEEALVGTYLESLPEDGSADLADEMTPTVE